MTKKTSLHELHLGSSAKMFNFHGWDMPIHYGSQLKEHELVRRACGLFDVSHMTLIDLEGEETKPLLLKLLSNDINQLYDNYDALYSAILNEAGGVVDDLIAYKIPNGYRLVVNCATRETVLKWLKNYSQGKKVKIIERNDLSMIAIQGPLSSKILKKCYGEDISSNLKQKKPFQGCFVENALITNTGYTGEKGVEVMLPHSEAKVLWKKALYFGAKPIGLAARDTLRLEAGLNLFGSEMDNTTSPLECNMGWTVSLEDRNRNFIGKKPFLKKKEEGNFPVLKGLVFEEKSIIRDEQEIYFDKEKKIKGLVTSGSYSPTLKKSIALARMPFTKSKTCTAETRGKIIKASIGTPRFVKEGKIIFKD